MEEIEIQTLVVEEKKQPVQEIIPKKRGKGRPPKADLEAVRNRTKGKRGRPKNATGRLQEFKERFLATGGTRILDTMIRIALDDNHPGQMAAIKLAIDRMLPVSAFDASKNGGQNPQITINISGINEPQLLESSSDDEVIDV